VAGRTYFGESKPPKAAPGKTPGTTEAGSEELSGRDDGRVWGEGSPGKRLSFGSEAAPFDLFGGAPPVRLYTLLGAPQVPKTMHALVVLTVRHQKGQN